jgi:hypothetical protein
MIMRNTEPRPETRARLKGLALLALSLSPLLLLTACIQPHAVFEPFSLVNVQVVAPPNLTVAGIRVSITGSGLIAGDNDFAFTDSTGFATIRTKETGFHYIVGRHATYDMGYGGTVANLSLGGPLQVFTRGRLEIPRIGVTVSPDFFFPFTGVDAPPLKPPRQVSVRLKKPGKVRFVYFAEDSPILRRTLAPDNMPQPSGKVFVTGDFNNFSLTTEDVDPVNGAKELFDDGSFQVPDGDDQIGDGVFTRVLDLPPGEHTYAFLVNGVGLYSRDPHEEFSKQVVIGVRTPDNSVANRRVLEIRELRASAVTVTSDPRSITN